MNQRDAVTRRLLTAAKDLFPKQGYDGTSVRELTSRARANLGAITYHFGSKEALYHAALAGLAEDMGLRVSAASKHEGPPLDRVEAIMRAFLDHVAQHPGAPASLLRELAGGGPLPPPLASIMKRNVGTIVAAIVDGQKDGSIRAGDPVLLAMSVVAQPFYIAIAGRVIKEALGLDVKNPASRAKIVDHVAATIRYSLTSHPQVRP